VASAPPDEGPKGVLYALGAFGIWGLSPIYFKAVAAVPATEVLAHRTVWAMLLLVAILHLRGRGRVLLAELRTGERRGTYLATTALLASNWLLFIWAIQNDRVLDASLGYYINPLVSVLLGVAFLRERLSPWQTLAVALAACGVLNLVLGHGELPWVSLAIAGSFGLYGLLRKRAGLDAMLGLAVETVLIAPIALAWLGALALQGAGSFGRGGIGVDALLAFSGVITAVPLVCFLEGVRRLRLATVGLMQYTAPTLMLLLGVFAFGEPFGTARAITFALVWAALAIYSADSVAVARAARAARLRRETGA